MNGTRVWRFRRHRDGSPCAHIHGKGRKQRTVPLWQSTAALVRAWRRQLGDVADDAPLFPNRGGTAMIRSNVTQRLALCVKSAAEGDPPGAQTN